MILAIILKLFFKCIIRSFPRETVIYWRKVMSDLIKITTNIATLKNRWSKKWPLSKNGLLSSTTDNDWNTQTYWVFPIFSIISSSWLSLIYREAIDFCMFILHPIFLLNYLVNTNRFSVTSPGFSGELILLTASNYFFFSFPKIRPLISDVYLTTLVRIFKPVINNSVDCEYLYFMPSFSGCNFSMLRDIFS